VGGAFGGKVSRSMPVAAAAALAASITRKRVRFQLDRNSDMRLNGGALLSLQQNGASRCTAAVMSLLTCRLFKGFKLYCMRAGRSETMVEYDAGFDGEGKVSALRVRGYFLCGASMDLGFNDMMVLQTGADQVLGFRV
jgi:xanthine dehydrogenase molybdopterin-binding subunit B